MTAAVPTIRLTQRELDVMGVLWALGEATVHEVRERVDPALAYTSVSTLLRLLETKGYVAHRRGAGKTHVYYPLVPAEQAGATALGRLLDKVYGGSPIRLLAHLVDHRRLSEQERARMRALLDRPPSPDGSE